MTVHLDIGGEGRYLGAINVNPWSATSTTGTPGRPIPNLVRAVGERLPFRAGIADLITMENAPLRAGAADEIVRLLKPGGTVRLLHPLPYAGGVHDAIAAALGENLAARATLRLGDDMLQTTLRRAVALIR